MFFDVLHQKWSAIFHYFKLGFYNKRFNILSVRQGALKALTTIKVTTKSISESIQRFQIIGQHNGVKIIWIPGRDGFDGNEREDSLARIGAAFTQEGSKI